MSSDWSWADKYFGNKKSVTSYKSSESATEFRTTGNKHFEKKDFKLALQYYNQVVIFAVIFILYLYKTF